MPILCHDDCVAKAMKTLRYPIYGDNDLIALFDREGTRWHEVVLNVNYDECVRILHLEVSDEA